MMWSRVVALLSRGVPVATPQAAAAFRIVFGSLALFIVLSDPVDHEHLSGDAVRNARGLQRLVVEPLAAAPGFVDSLHLVVAGTGVAFVVGVATRLAFAAFAAATFLWASVLTVQSSHHPVSALLVACVALLAAPWGDAWSIDAWLRRRLRRHTEARPSVRYGYTFWAPGFVFGVAFFAAALSKLRYGPDWIVNGTVRYHFVTDLENAMVTWGPQLTSHPAAAIGLSALAVAVEGLLITASFTRSAWMRAALGAGAMALLCGFAVFQGVRWPLWWLLLLSFLPWQRIGRAAQRDAASTLAAPQVALAVLIAAQQAAVTPFRVEVPPLISAYDMYSGTYASDTAYEEQGRIVYRVVVEERGRRYELTGCEVDAAVARAAREAAEKAAVLKAALERCPAAAATGLVTLHGDRRFYDWNAMQFTWRRDVDVVGPIALAP